MRGHLRGRKPLKKLFAFLATFCMLSGALALVNLIKTEAAGEYHINITSNDTSMGGFGYGGDCTGTMYADYRAQADYDYERPFPNGGNVITACPASGYYFDHWLVNGQRAGTNPTQAQFYSWYSDVVYDSNNEINIEAVFIDAFSVVANVDAGVGGTIQMGWINPSDYTAVPINGTATNEITFSVPDTGNSVTTDTITATPDQGYMFAGVTTSGTNVVYNNLGNNQFTLTISGDGTATVLFAPIAYTATINAGTGTATVPVPTDANYTVTDNGTSTVSVTSTSTNVQVPVTITPAGGYEANSVTTSGSVSYNNDLSNNAFSFTITGDGGQVTVNYAAVNTAEIYISNGTLNAWGNDITLTNNQTAHVTATARGTQTLTVQPSPSGGYRVNAANPVSTTGSVTYNNDYNGSQFTLSIAGDGTATVNLEQITYTATINAGAGTATVPTSTNYTVTNSGTSTVTVTSTSTNISVPVSITPPSGNVVDSVSVTGSAGYNGDLNGNDFSFTITGDGGQVSVSYAPAYVVSVDAGSGTSAVSGNNITISDNNTGLVAITATGSKSANITVTPPSGYSVDSSNPVTVTGDVSYSNYNNNSFTINMTGAGTVTVNYTGPYNVLLDAGSGTVSVASGTGYTVANNNTSLATVTTSGNITTGTITVTAPSGYMLSPSNPITSTNGTTTYSNLSGDTLTLSMAGADTVTFNYISGSPYVTSFDVSPSAGGTLKQGWSCNGSTISSLPYVSTNTTASVIYPSDGALTACPESGYVLAGWRISGDNITTFDITSGNNLASFHQWIGGSNVYDRMFANDTHNVTVTAMFVSDPAYSVTFVSDDSSHGTVKISSGSNYTANPDGTAAASVVVSSDGQSGDLNVARVDGVPASGYFLQSFTSANNTEQQTVSSWQELNNVGNAYGFTLTGADTITAHFAQFTDIVYEVSVNLPSVGSIDIQNTDCSTSTNQTFTKTLIDNGSYFQPALDTNGHDLTACVDNGNYYFSHWVIDGWMNISQNATIDEVGYWPKNTNNHTLQAVFAPKATVTVMPDDSSHGSVSVPSGAGYTVTTSGNNTIIETAAGMNKTTGTINLSPANGYVFSYFEVMDGNVTVNRGSGNNDYTLTIDGNDTVIAHFEPATNVVVDDNSHGYIAYWDRYANHGQGAEVHLTNNEQYLASSSVVNDARYITGATGDFWAMPRSGYTFDHWDLNGTTVTTAERGVVRSGDIEYQAGSSGNLPTLTANFREYSLYHVFTGYNDAHGFFDHYLPETQRTGGNGAQAGDYDLDDNPFPQGATAKRSSDTHATAPNGYYFAYWITGCNSSFMASEQVETSPGNYIDMNVLGNETIMTRDTYFRPTTEQFNECSEYVAVWYRVNQQRLIASSENESIGTVQTSTDTGSPNLGLCGRTAAGTSRLMRTVANMGVYDTANGLSIDCYPTTVITNPSYEVDHWELNGKTLYENGNIVRSEQIRKRVYTQSDGSALYIKGDSLNDLIVYFRLKELPHTGSIAIWFIVGGGVAAVAVPSVILLISERKEQKKGGKK